MGTLLAVLMLQTVAFVVQWAAGAAPIVAITAITAITAIAAAGLAPSALASTNGARILRYAPGDTATASAAVSTAFNDGIMLGALTGSISETAPSPVAVPLVGAVITSAALLACTRDPILARRFASRDAGLRVSFRRTARTSR